MNPGPDSRLRLQAAGSDSGLPLPAQRLQAQHNSYELRELQLLTLLMSKMFTFFLTASGRGGGSTQAVSLTVFSQFFLTLPLES